MNMQICFVLVVVLALVSTSLGAAKKAEKKKSNPNDNRGNTPFFLQDPQDQTCLGPTGFTVCDERALWILTRRPGRKTYSLVSLLGTSGNEGACLQKKDGWFFGMIGGSDRVVMGSCSTTGAKSWDFEFIDQSHVKLSNRGQCLVRGKKSNYRNSMSVQSCKKGEFSPLTYHPTAVHENGFYLKSADGSCFDGSSFHNCQKTGANMLWGIGIKYVWGEAQRYFFNFHVNERSQCVVSSGSKINKAACKNKGALGWNLSDGQLSQGRGRKVCVARKNDNTGVIAKCKDASEYLSMDVPTVYSAEDLEEMLKNPDKLSPEEKEAVAKLAKQYSLR